MTLPREDLIRLRHLRDAAEKAVHYARGKRREDLDSDEILRLALTKLVEIVGEAAKQVSSRTRAAHASVPWSAAARMRDRLVHHYFDIDLDILWQTISEDLPQLLEAIPDVADIDVEADHSHPHPESDEEAPI
jgi:uncharacterized protein with HEPN domain